MDQSGVPFKILVAALLKGTSPRKKKIIDVLIAVGSISIVMTTAPPPGVESFQCAD